MPRLPDRFDLFVRQAQTCADPERQVDYILGALMGLMEWHFVNRGSGDFPRPAEVVLEGFSYLLVFSDPERLQEAAGAEGAFASIISIPSAQALPWCLGQEACAGLLVNPGQAAALLSRSHLSSFYQAWQERETTPARSFWIPNLTSEEEDFWQEHGL